MHQKTFNKTAVIWSFDYRSITDSQVIDIVESDVNAIRVVGDSQNIDTCLTAVDRIRTAFDKLHKPVPIILDTAPKARGFVANLPEPLHLTLDSNLLVTPSGKGGDIEIDTDEWQDFFRIGTQVFIGSGDIALLPESASDNGFVMRVLQNGKLESGMEIHCPVTRKPLAFSDLDQETYAKILKHEVDYLVVPGIEDPNELRSLQKYLKTLSKSPPWLVVKVDSERMAACCESLLPYVHGVLISRLEIAMCVNPARVPMMTKEIIQRCNDNAKLVLVASDILKSMRKNATPTRAEVSDIANAALDGADGVVLSDQLASGRHAARGLILAQRAISDIEMKSMTRQLNWLKHAPVVSHTLAAVTFAAYRTAHRIRAKAIVCLTNRGNTALLLSSFRTDIPIFAITMSEEVLRRVGLVRGVHGIFLEESPDLEFVFPVINDRIVRETWLRPEDQIVFVSVSLSSVGEKASNLFTIQTLK